MKNPNVDIVAAANARGWFEARKTGPVWARELDEDTTVETPEGSIQAQAGDYLCRGPKGEQWPQTEGALRCKYTPSDEVGDDGFRRWEPKSHRARVFASVLTEDTQVAVTGGTMLGGAGDLLVQAWSESGPDAPDDVWIVEKSIFEMTYARES